MKKAINNVLGFGGAILLLLAVSWITKVVPHTSYIWIIGAIVVVVATVYKARKRS